jgi:hypothetical protein
MLLQQSRRTNGDPKSIRIHTKFESWGKNSPNINRLTDNNANATKPEETHKSNRINQDKVIELENQEWKWNSAGPRHMRGTVGMG